MQIGSLSGEHRSRRRRTRTATSAPASAVGVQFVQNYELEAGCICDYLRVKIVLPRQQQLGHHVVGQENIWRAGGNSLTLFSAFLTCVTLHHRPEVVGQTRTSDELVNFLQLAISRAFIG